MKIRNGFISNSSSTAFIITNHTDQEKSLVDFVNENPELIVNYRDIYTWSEEEALRYTQEALLESAGQNNLIFRPGQRRYTIFGDEDGTMIGAVFDYILRNGGKSESFSWKFEEYRR